MPLEILQDIVMHIVVAAILGGLIGFQKDVNKNSYIGEDNNSLDSDFGGVRAFSMIAIFGVICAKLDFVIFQTSISIFTILGFVIISAFILLNYSSALKEGKDRSLATEVGGLLTFLMGVMIMFNEYSMAAILAVLIAIIISLREYLERIIANVGIEEVKTTLKFCVVTFVILPLLPNVNFTISEILNYLIGMNLGSALKEGNFLHTLVTVEFLNPYKIWFFVVAMSAVSYVGYILGKILGSNSGIVLSAAVGGMVSSTAVTASMTAKSKTDTSNRSSYITGTLVASCIMFVRVIMIVLFISPNILKEIFIPTFVMLGVFGGLTLFFFLRSRKEKQVAVEGVKVDSPFKIMPAIKFAGFILFIKFISVLGQASSEGIKTFLLNLPLGDNAKSFISENIGAFINYLIGLISGLADVDAITETMSSNTLVEVNPLPFEIAGITILIAVMSNNIVKGTLAKTGEKEYGKKVFNTFLASVIAGVICIVGLNIL